jgi:hypothetical protein
MTAPWAQACWNVASPIRLRNPGKVSWSDGAVGVFPLHGQRRQPLQVIADA